MRKLAFLIFLCLGNFADGQDTIYVYETVNITDTVWLDVYFERDTTQLVPLNEIQNASLLLDTVTQNATLIYFSANKSATIPINHILIDENQLKHTKMERAGFFTLMFMAFQNIVFAQPEISIKAGLTMFSESNSTIYGSHKYIGMNEGVEIKTFFSNSNFAYSFGLDYSGFGDQEYKILNDSEGNVEYEFKAISHVSQISVPLLIYYKYKRIEAFMGYEYRFVNSNTKSDPIVFPTLKRYRHEHGLSAGLELSILKNFSLIGKMYFGDPIGKEGNQVISGNSFDFSLKYYLNRNREFKNK